jgi:phage major head subunit gpT-like protein
MPIVRSDIPKLLTAGIKTAFFEAMESMEPAQYERVASIISSTGEVETYAWLGRTPQMREFKGERQPAGMAEYSYAITNKTWESSISVERAALEDERYGQIRTRINSLAERVRFHRDKLVFELLQNGFATTCYDGQYFFDNGHIEGNSGTQSNLGSAALDAASLKAGITAMMKFVDDKGEPLGIIPDTLVVPPDLQWTAKELTTSPIVVVNVGDGTAGSGAIAATDYNNVLRGSLDVIVSPYLTDTTDWYLLCTRRVVKPIIFQERVPVEFASLEEESESGFMRDEYVYGVRARYNVGYGPWQYAYGSHQ